MFSLLCLKAHLCNSDEDSVLPPNCQQYAPTQSDKVNIKIQTSMMHNV